MHLCCCHNIREYRTSFYRLGTRQSEENCHVEVTEIIRVKADLQDAHEARSWCHHTRWQTLSGMSGSPDGASLVNNCCEVTWVHHTALKTLAFVFHLTPGSHWVRSHDVTLILLIILSPTLSSPHAALLFLFFFFSSFIFFSHQDTPGKNELRNPLLALCWYDRWLFSGTELVPALEGHLVLA